MNGGYIMIDFKGFDVTKPDSVTIPDIRKKLLAAAQYGKMVLCYNIKKRGVVISAIPNCVDSSGSLMFSDFALNVSDEDAVTVGKTALSVLANMTGKNMSPSSGATVGAAGNVVNNADISLPAGKYIISFKSTSDTVGVQLKLGSTTVINQMKAVDGYCSVSFTAATAATKYTLYANGACTVSELMIRPYEITDPTFVAYTPDNAGLYALIQAL